MFHSAIVRLTGWYLLILMSVSLLFSLTLYNVAINEVRERIGDFGSHVDEPGFSSYSTNPRIFTIYSNQQMETANHNLVISLLYINLLILLGGGVLCYLLARHTLRDIEHTHDAQSRFTSDVSHELRTPLAAMRTELEVALRDPKLPKSEMRELLQSNLEEVARMTELSQTLLHLSKLDYASLDFLPLNLETTVAEVVQRYDKNFSRINLNAPKSPLIIKANQPSIEELFTILVDNALKYSPENSSITAVLSASNKSAQFIITNSGAGIPRDKLPYIFDRFYRIDDSRNHGGAGLGLALAKEIVALHKGELSVKSAKNKKTMFAVTLPLMKKNEPSYKQKNSKK